MCNVRTYIYTPIQIHTYTRAYVHTCIHNYTYYATVAVHAYSHYDDDFSTLFGGKGKSQQELTPTGNQSAKREQKQESSKAASSSPSRRLVFKKSDVEKSTTALILQPRPQSVCHSGHYFTL